jgi:hypothetical protein
MENTSTTARRPAETQDATPPASESQKPIAVLRFGSVSASVFENEVKAGERTVSVPSVSLRRAYRDGKSALKFTHSLRQQDLLVAALALTKAFEFIEGDRAADKQ